MFRLSISVMSEKSRSFHHTRAAGYRHTRKARGGSSSSSSQGVKSHQPCSGDKRFSLTAKSGRVESWIRASVFLRKYSSFNRRRHARSTVQFVVRGPAAVVSWRHHLVPGLLISVRLSTRPAVSTTRLPAASCSAVTRRSARKGRCSLGSGVAICEAEQVGPLHESRGSRLLFATRAFLRFAP